MVVYEKLSTIMSAYPLLYAFRLQALKCRKSNILFKSFNYILWDQCFFAVSAFCILLTGCMSVFLHFCAVYGQFVLVVTHRMNRFFSPSWPHILYHSLPLQIPCKLCTGWTVCYRKSVLHLIKWTWNMCLSRCSTDLR